MKFLDILILLMLLILLGIGAYILWNNFPGETEYEEYRMDSSSVRISEGGQFYPNMRYKDRVISYSISGGCNLKQTNNADRAFSILSEKTILKFNKLNKDAEITVLCSEIAPEPEQKGHFVAGEGGPSQIINSSDYAVIFSGKISLFRENECENPNIALHEILHALGFDHNDNENSIMFPLTKCNQQIDQYILDEINKLYKVNSNPDLAIESIISNKSGRYLNFNIGIINSGLKDSKSSRLIIKVDDVLVKDFDLGEIEIGTKKILTVENLRVPRNSDIINFLIETGEPEIEEENNSVDVVFQKKTG